MNFEQAISEIKKRVNLADVIGRYTNLSKRGPSLIGLCPFHNEKTPSFWVHPHKGFFKCFGCDATGDLFTFLEKKENYRFKDVVYKYADELHLDLKGTAGGRASSQKRRGLMDVLGAANDCFRKALMDSVGSEPRGYLRLRAITSSLAEKFQLGFGLRSSDEFFRDFKFAASEFQLLKEVGLAAGQEANPFAPYHERITFPVRDEFGQVVGFGGRDISKRPEAGRPKYINSPASEIYDKSTILFGLYEARPLIEKGRPLILCEGNFDVLAIQALGLAGFAACGTAVTAQHVNLISKYRGEVTLAMDSDDAGQSAAKKALLLFLKAGFHVKWAQLPGSDPADMWEKGQKKPLFDALVHAEDALEMLIKSHKPGFGEHVQARLKRLDEIFVFLVALKRPLAIKQYLQTIALHFSEAYADIAMEFKRFCRIGGHRIPEGKVEKISLETQAETWEILLASLLLRFPELLKKHEDILAWPLSVSILELIKQIVQIQREPEPSDLKSFLAKIRLPKTSPLLGPLMAYLSDTLQLEAAERSIEDIKQSIFLKQKRLALGEIQRNIIDAQKLGDSEAVKRSLRSQRDWLTANMTQNR